MLPALAFFLAATSLSAQVTERIDVSAIEVPVVVRDAKGQLPLDLTPSDFVLLEDGVPQEIIGVSYPVRRSAVRRRPAARRRPRLLPRRRSVAAERRWQIVIYHPAVALLHALAQRSSLTAPRAARGEADSARRRMIVGDEGGAPHVISSGDSNDGETLRKTLLDLAQKIAGWFSGRGHPAADAVPLRAWSHDAFAATVGGEPARPLPLRSGAGDGRGWRRRLFACGRRRMLTWTARFQEPGRQHCTCSSSPPATTSTHTTSTDRLIPPRTRSCAASARHRDRRKSPRRDGERLDDPQLRARLDGDRILTNLRCSSNSGRGRLNDFIRGIERHRDAHRAERAPLDALRTLAEESGGSVQTNAAKLTTDLDQLAEPSRDHVSASQTSRRASAPHRSPLAAAGTDRARATFCRRRISGRRWPSLGHRCWRRMKESAANFPYAARCASWRHRRTPKTLRHSWRRWSHSRQSTPFVQG